MAARPGGAEELAARPTAPCAREVGGPRASVGARRRGQLQSPCTTPGRRWPSLGLVATVEGGRWRPLVGISNKIRKLPQVPPNGARWASGAA